MDSHDHDTADTVSGPTSPGGDGYQVRHTEVFGWTVCHGPNLEFARTDDGGFAIGYRTAEDAHAAITTAHTTDGCDDTDGM